MRFFKLKRNKTFKLKTKTLKKDLIEYMKYITDAQIIE